MRTSLSLQTQDVRDRLTTLLRNVGSCSSVQSKKIIQPAQCHTDSSELYTRAQTNTADTGERDKGWMGWEFRVEQFLRHRRRDRCRDTESEKKRDCVTQAEFWGYCCVFSPRSAALTLPAACLGVCTPCGLQQRVSQESRGTLFTNKSTKNEMLTFPRFDLPKGFSFIFYCVYLFGTFTLKIISWVEILDAFTRFLDIGTV